MAIDGAARRIIEAKIVDNEGIRYRSTRDNIITIISHLSVSQIELSLAIGVYAPPFGKGGNCAVNSWYRGNERPTELHYRVIECLASGYMRLRQVGFDNRRLIFNVFGEFCPGCNQLLRRFLDKDECTCCSFSSNRIEDPTIRVVDHREISRLPEVLFRIRRILPEYSCGMISARLIRCDSSVVEIWIDAKRDEQIPSRSKMLDAAIAVMSSDGIKCGKQTKLKLRIG